MAVRLDVPLVYQKKAMSCWYASACMVAYFREAGPRLGIPGRWTANNGVGLADFALLAQNEGLVAIKSPAAALTAQQLEVMLRNNGPLWCAGQWDGVGHIVVLTGVGDGNVYINDPSPSVGRRVETVAWFNQKLDNHVAGCLMYKPKSS